MANKKYYSIKKSSYRSKYPIRSYGGYGNYGRKRISPWKIILMIFAILAVLAAAAALCIHFGVFGKKEDDKKTQQISSSASQPSGQNSTEPSAEPQKEPETKWVENVFLYGNTGFEIFNENKTAEKEYAAAVSLVKASLGDDVSVYCMIAPTHSLIALPEKYRGGADEKKSISDVYSALDKRIITVSVEDTMTKHKDEYIYFRTDNNWTAQGAYYAYEDFCTAAQTDPVKLDTLASGKIDGFKGSLHAATITDEQPDGCPELDRNPDTVTYYKTDGYCKLLENGRDEEREVPMIAEFAAGSNAYSAFIWGNNPYMHIETSLQTGRKLCIIKDSFGCAFAPFTAANFDEVMIVDPSYYDGNVLDYIKENKYTDVLVLNSSYTANNSQRVDELKTIL